MYVSKKITTMALFVKIAETLGVKEKDLFDFE